MPRKHLIPFLIFGLVLVSFTSSKKTGLKFAQKTLDGFCSLIPSGLSLVDGDTLSVQSFYMSSTEITNKEYNEFLADLLRRGDLDTYAIARIDTAGWTRSFPKEYMKPMAEYYHKHPAYDNYPVVNVSKAGAELYCKWLTAKYDSLSNGQLNLMFRVPTRAEWIRAASSDNLGSTYSWDSPSLRNDKGCMLANFLVLGSENISRNAETGELEVKKMVHIPSDFTADITAPSKSYFPNSYGIYNMNGNVAEMISDGNYAVGGDWNSPGYDIRNRSIKEINRPEPTVGFRVVSSVFGGEIRHR